MINLISFFCRKVQKFLYKDRIKNDFSTLFGKKNKLFWTLKNYIRYISNFLHNSLCTLAFLITSSIFLCFSDFFGNKQKSILILITKNKQEYSLKANYIQEVERTRISIFRIYLLFLQKPEYFMEFKFRTDLLRVALDLSEMGLD